MGYTTDLIGHVNIRPALNDAEVAYLSALHQSRRYDRGDGPYDVPPNPAADEGERPADVDRYNRVARGQPSLRCGWSVSWDGTSLAHDGLEKFYASAPWLAYLIDHFLRPGAHASATGLDCFREFTFDHVLDGIIAANRRDIRELSLIHVEHNEVTTEVLVPGESEWPEELLPYEVSLDRDHEARYARTARRRLRVVS